VSKLRVVVADDQTLMREAVRMVLEGEAGMAVVGEAASGAELLELLKRERADVALVDLAMPPVDGIELLERIRIEHPATKAIVLSATDDRRQIAAALRRGAAAFVLKNVDPLDVPAIIRQVVDGTTFLAVPGDDDLRAGARAALSDRELAVLVELAEGRTNKEIAGRLWVSEETVKFHLRNIYRKLAVSSRTDAIRFAHENDLVEVELQGL
jgi:DNA-binding NarL/FixJ family response regulator